MLQRKRCEICSYLGCRGGRGGGGGVTRRLPTTCLAQQNCKTIVRRTLTSCYHGSKISGSQEEAWNMSAAKSCFHDISSEKVSKFRKWGWANFVVDCFIAEKLAVLKQFWIKEEERQATDKVRSVSYQAGIINTIFCCIVCVWYQFKLQIVYVAENRRRFREIRKRVPEEFSVATDIDNISYISVWKTGAAESLPSI